MKEIAAAGMGQEGRGQSAVYTGASRMPELHRVVHWVACPAPSHLVSFRPSARPCHARGQAQCLLHCSCQSQWRYASVCCSLQEEAEESTQLSDGGLSPSSMSLYQCHLGSTHCLLVPSNGRMIAYAVLCSYAVLDSHVVLQTRAAAARDTAQGDNECTTGMNHSQVCVSICEARDIDQAHNASTLIVCITIRFKI